MAMKTLPKRSELAAEHTWDLESIYPTTAAWEADFTRLQGLLPGIAALNGTLGESAGAFLQALKRQDEASELLGRLYAFAHMRLDEDTTNNASQALLDRITTLAHEFSTASSYIVPEVLSIPEARMDGFLAEEPQLQVYRHLLDEINRERPHVLSAEMEALLAQAGELEGAPGRIFSMFNNADLKLPTVRDEQSQEVQLTQGNYGTRFLESHDQRVRRDAFEAMLGSYEKYENTLTATYASRIKGDIFFARARHYSSALEAALEPRNIPMSVYDNLVAAVNEGLPVLHRYLSLRKKLMGLETLHMYDLYVPLVREVEYKIAYPDAREQVARALAPLGANYVGILRHGLDSRWVDVYENVGKRSGAYSSGAYGTHPFILMNYQDSMDSMFTLAHELGHSMHSQFTRATQPYPYADYTIFVAEVASTLNEALLTHELLRTTTDRAQRMYIINHALEGFRATLFRQTLFAEFEREVHARAEAGEALTPEMLRTLYLHLNQRYYGAVVQVDDLISIEWARIPHFYSSFYVYQYATGISASTALSEQIIREGQPAVDRYLRFLSSGSSDYSINLLRNAGVDLLTPEPVRAAIATFGRYIDQMEQML